MLKAGIIGATGYTGIELVKLLRGHPAAEIGWLTSESYAGQRLSDVFPAPWDDPLLPLEAAPLEAADVVFLCLPHAASMPAVAAVRAAGVKAIDLSADFRLHDASVYQRWYNHPQSQPALLAESVYGLPELHRTEIAAASLVANPGCYATSVILGLWPLAHAGWLTGTVIADSKSGVSGAGRKPSLTTSFVEANENLSPYNIGYAHRHIAEMEQELHAAKDTEQAAGWHLVFSPHLLPVNRGILSTMYVSLPDGVDEAAVRGTYDAAFTGEPFVHVLPAGRLATLQHAVNTNRCAIGLTFVPGQSTLIVTSAIDNLLKGASGQAVQNMNVMFGLDETSGLPQ
ncbi:MAG: N-acetyl-gamma-glutamyl-phosphate reductase [Caldilineae bacterium]|nr:N-acetyl-gamma-glutamyl-phosphate reductase [Caldilineae bacterium]